MTPANPKSPRATTSRLFRWLIGILTGVLLAMLVPQEHFANARFRGSQVCRTLNVSKGSAQRSVGGLPKDDVLVRSTL